MEYKSNSNKSKMEEKHVEKVISGNATSKEKTTRRRLADVFISDDVEDVKSYILFDVIIPSVKKTISDVVTDGIDMILFGESGRKNKKKDGYTSYSRFSERKDEDHHERSKRVGFEVKDIYLESRSEVEDVIDGMEDLIETYGVISVADLYDLVGLTGSHTDNKYGWNSIRNVNYRRTRDGEYLLILPKPKAI